MGSYNSQYESYYSTLVNRRKNTGGYNYNRHKNQSFALDGRFFMKRLVVDLVGIFVLFIFVISCKLVATPQTAAAYKYSKEIINKNYDYNSALSSIKKYNIKAIEDKTMDWMENIKSKLTGTKTLKDKLKANYMIPVEGTITSGFGERNDPITNEKKLHEGIDLDAKEGAEIACSFEGKVEEIGEDGQLGKYVIINHGGGIETKYANLKDILVKKDASVKKGEIIAKSGKTVESTAPHLHFEVLYMGENKNPEDYLNFAKK